MANFISSVSILQKYSQGVMARASHHAKEVESAVLTLIGALVWAKDEDTELTVRTYNDETANVLWAYIGGHKYAFTYDHETGKIVVRDRSLQGKQVFNIDNKTPSTEILAFFNKALLMSPSAKETDFNPTNRDPDLPF